MKNTFPFRKTSGSILVLFAIFLFSSCKKNNPANLEVIPTAPATYSLLRIDYYLEPGDKVYTTTHKLKSYELRNTLNIQTQHSYFEDFQELNRKSLFSLKDVNGDLAKVMGLSKLTLETPTIVNISTLYTIYTQNEGWTMSTNLQEKPFNYLEPKNQVLRVPAKSSITVDRSIQEYSAIVTFRATIKNDKTGETHAVKGKWNGTLSFSNYDVTLSQKSLK
ncbi:hypothetical protein [Pedobacter gandavensis]|uniref:hypothetical protein n=1 Tax=Pedobacter gandavensis TaxID=2679963 RepID=UPI00292DA2E6|nr:hypothetical protein [Pedobacter gandavensis]